ncbi:MAG: segregation and condensation protein A [Alphaproteobacteria bacterium]
MGEIAREWVVDLAGYEGPIDLLLSLARDKKVDLTAISISELADQYLSFIAQAKDARLEVAAEYLVMAAWLAYLKSRLLLPRDLPIGDAPSATQMAKALAEQMRRLEAMQQAAGQMMKLPRLGRDWMRHGTPEGLPTQRDIQWHGDLVGLLRAYGAICAKRTPPPVLTVDPGLLTSVDDALTWLQSIVGTLPVWQDLEEFLPRGLKPGIQQRSALAATFVASLELAKAGKVRLHQDQVYGRLFITPRTGDQGELDLGPPPNG